MGCYSNRQYIAIHGVDYLINVPILLLQCTVIIQYVHATPVY